MIEWLVRGKYFRRYLPAQYGKRPIWVSPDARLRFLLPGKKGFDNELLKYSSLIKPADIVIDVGANVGEFALAAAHRAQSEGAVLAVEADPFLVNILLRTSQEERNQDINLSVLDSAVSDENALKRFIIAKRGRAANALDGFGTTQMGGSRGELWKNTTTIDQIVKDWRLPNVIKIDVEGAELLVLKGAIKTIQAHRPIIIIEVSQNIKKISLMLKEMNYILFDAEKGVESMPIETCVFNTIAIPKEKLTTLLNNQLSDI